MLSDGDRSWLQGRFDSQSGKLEDFQREFNNHVLDDREALNAVHNCTQGLKAHLDAHEATKLRARRSWVFWVGIGVAMVSPIAATIIEHWLFTKHVVEKLSK